MSIIHVVSVSGGKDSAATLLLAIKRFGVHRVRGIFCDTGNEHDHVYEYLDYLERATGVTIIRLKADFSLEIGIKRLFIARDKRVGRQYDTRPVFEADGKTPVPKRDGRGQIVLDKKGNPVQKTVKVGGGRRIRWTNKAKRRALAVLYPTGNPYLDLCLWKGRFPSRKAQFCTEHLKRNMAVEYQLELVEDGHTVVSWQGVRRDESHSRRNAKLFERLDDRMYAYRPLVEWSAMDVFDYCRSLGIEPNPLYKQGMNRVGCMPCINAAKSEVKEIALRFPEHIQQKAEWEHLVGQASKRGAATFFTAPGETHTARERGNIWQVVEWSKTSRGGKQFSLLTALEEPARCASAYGLCE